MFKVEDAIGDVVFIAFRDIDKIRDLGIDSPSGHYLIKGIDHIGLWLEHPGVILAKTVDEDGKPLPDKKIIKERVDANFLVTWDNINSMMHYPDREGYDFPSEFNLDVGFKP
ncbi:MAG: hypothetical protein CMG66_06535 [Candidatus Marinimicrobia bacterium]|nr:hypothetical protein [Candidatus Neomarinimicrobiota bacterium]|tara:strand:+ start:65112 stop:65447 length:336 start_codon:yes stop_codon:yes gene_type:complete